jgi:hypothetical protein
MLVPDWMGENGRPTARAYEVGLARTREGGWDWNRTLIGTIKDQAKANRKAKQFSKAPIGCQAGDISAAGP